MIKGLALLGEMEARLAAQVGFAVESLRYGGRAADDADGENLDFKNSALVFNAQLISGANFARGLGAQAVGLNAADVAGSRGQGARLKEARGPKPFVNAHSVHLEIRKNQQMLSGFAGSLPEIEMVGVARCGHGQPILMRSAIERGADICFAVGQSSEGNFEGAVGRQSM